MSFMPEAGPDGTTCGFDPMNAGVTEGNSPGTLVKLRDRWWPSNRHAHGASIDGSPNTET